MSYDTQKPFLSSYVIIRRDNKIAFVLRSKTGWLDGNYTVPAGKVEHQERFLQAAVREGKEEAGVILTQQDLIFVHMMHRSTDDATRYWIDVFFEAQKWKGEPYNAEPHMHGELVWLDPQNLPANMVPNVRYALEQIEIGKMYSEFGWAS